LDDLLNAMDRTAANLAKFGVLAGESATDRRAGEDPFAQALGGGLVAAIDGMRFVVPVPSLYTRPNRK
jgi:hypothetical protein